jgi:hypothetical protein
VQSLPAYAVVVVATAELLAASVSATRPDEFFVHPEVLCKALEHYGIHTKPWAPIGLGPHPASTPFDCEYRGVPETEPPSVDEHTTVFRVSGNYAQRADTISLAITIGDPSNWQPAQEEFLRLVSGLFNAIGKLEPDGLIGAINARRYYLRRLSYGVLWFNFIAPMEPSKRRTFWLRLSQASVPTNR